MLGIAIDSLMMFRLCSKVNSRVQHDRFANSIADFARIAIDNPVNENINRTRGAASSMIDPATGTQQRDHPNSRESWKDDSDLKRTRLVRLEHQT
jgi:hypothetical protein